MFLNHFFVFFCHFLIQSNQKHTFSFRPFTSDFVHFMSIITKTTICLVIQKLKPRNVCICSDIFEENALPNGFCQSGVNFGQIMNKLLEVSGVKVLKNQRYSQFFLLSPFFYECNAA